MSLKDALTEHANVLRSKTGVSDTISITNSWDYHEQLISAHNMPVNANLDFRAITNCKGKVADLKLIEV